RMASRKKTCWETAILGSYIRNAYIFPEASESPQGETAGTGKKQQPGRRLRRPQPADWSLSRRAVLRNATGVGTGTLYWLKVGGVDSMPATARAAISALRREPTPNASCLSRMGAA